LGIGVVPGAAQDPVVSSSKPVERVLKLVRQRELDQLHLRIGRFTSGEAAVFVGELKATERGTGLESRTLPRGRVVASLVRREKPPESKGSGGTLTAVSARHDLWLRLSQSPDEPGVTRSTLLRPMRATAGVTGSCRACLADLGERPQTLGLDRFVAVGRLRDALGTEFRVELSGRLERVPPNELKLPDLEVLNPGLEHFLRDEVQGFTREGGEGIRRVERQLRQRVPPPEGSPPQTRCERVTHYSAERFVDLADLSRFGVRDPRILSTEVCCLDHDSHGESEECSAEEAG